MMGLLIVRRIARSRRIHLGHIAFCALIFCTIYVLLYQDLGISLPALEYDESLVEVPLRYVFLRLFILKLRNAFVEKYHLNQTL